MTGKIIWQSQAFPKLILTEQHLTLLRRNFPQIKRFEPLMKEMELWLHDKPHRAPRSNWKRFISTWCRKAAQYQEERALSHRPEQGDAARREENQPQLLGEIMNKLIERTRA